MRTEREPSGDVLKLSSAKLSTFSISVSRPVVIFSNNLS
jgi:hypothetical protein